MNKNYLTAEEYFEGLLPESKVQYSLWIKGRAGGSVVKRFEDDINHARRYIEEHKSGLIKGDMTAGFIDYYGGDVVGESINEHNQELMIKAYNALALISLEKDDIKPVLQYSDLDYSLDGLISIYRDKLKGIQRSMRRIHDIDVNDQRLVHVWWNIMFQRTIKPPAQTELYTKLFTSIFIYPCAYPHRIFRLPWIRAALSSGFEYCQLFGPYINVKIATTKTADDVKKLLCYDPTHITVHIMEDGDDPTENNDTI